jgi:hypothetical protein
MEMKKTTVVVKFVRQPSWWVLVEREAVANTCASSRGNTW